MRQILDGNCVIHVMVQNPPKTLVGFLHDATTRIHRHILGHCDNLCIKQRRKSRAGFDRHGTFTLRMLLHFPQIVLGCSA
nr:hypothetical protein [Aneurinibacillus terranovensis]